MFYADSNYSFCAIAPYLLKATHSDREKLQAHRKRSRLPSQRFAIALAQTHQAILLNSISVADKELLFREESSLARIFLSTNY